MKDLLALARLRALLVELGYTMRPASDQSQLDLLEAWMHRRSDLLDDRAPMELLLSDQAADLERVAHALKETIDRQQDRDD